MGDALFEKIIPGEKISEEAPEVKKGPDIIEMEKKQTETKTLIEDLEKELKALREKSTGLEKKIDDIEKNPPLLENLPGGKYIVRRMKTFEGIIDELNQKLDYVEDARDQMVSTHSGVKNMYSDIEKKLINLDTLLDRLRSFDKVFKLATRLEDLEFEIKNTWVPLNTIEKMKASIIEQNFFTLLSLLPLVRERESRMNIVSELRNLSEDMRRKNLWGTDKQLLMDEILRDNGINSLAHV